MTRLLSRPRGAVARRNGALRGLLLASGLALLALLALPPAARAADEIPVKVDRVKPLNDRLPMLRFLRDNRDFLRGRADALRARAGSDTAGGALFDPRLLAYGHDALAGNAARAGIAADADLLGRTRLLASVREMLALEDQLDRMKAALADQEERLARLTRDYTHEPTTALLLLLKGMPDAPYDSLVVTDETGQSWRFLPTATAREGLARGGLARVAYEFVEPRAQSFAVRLFGAAWLGRGPEYVTLEPAQDRISALELDLGGVSAARPTVALAARAWVEVATASALPATGASAPAPGADEGRR